MIKHKQNNIAAVKYKGQNISKIYHKGELVFGGEAQLVDITNQLIDYGYIDSGGQTSHSDVNWRRSGFLVSEAGWTYDVNVYAHPIINVISFYNINHEFISGQLGGASGTIPYSFNVVAPVNTAYVKICAANTDVKPDRVSSFLQYS